MGNTFVTQMVEKSLNLRKIPPFPSMVMVDGHYEKISMEEFEAVPQLISGLKVFFDFYNF
jgi:hypothetical protein